MKNLITVLAVAALMTSCQKDELNGVTESQVERTVYEGKWNVHEMLGSESDFINLDAEGEVYNSYESNYILPLELESIVITGDSIRKNYIQALDSKSMSRRFKLYTEGSDVFSTYGYDAMRLYNQSGELTNEYVVLVDPSYTTENLSFFFTYESQIVLTHR